MNEKNREFCLNLLHEYTQTDSLRKHAYAVEACVNAYAEKLNQDVEYWSNAALLHDFDYEKFPTPEEHPFKGAEILRGLGFEEEFILTIMSHTDHTGVPRDTLLKKVLFACDELAGFILAVAYVRPSKAVAEVEVKSVVKKLKDKAFARQVSREDIYNGAAGLEVNLEEHVSICLEAIKRNHEVLGV